MFAPVDPKQNFPKLEEEVLAYWKTHETFKKSLERTKDGGEYIFYDGPPFATGLPHYGHLLAGTMKDVVPRYWTMKGRHVERRFGWDCHGLPVEYEVEKELGLAGRKDIVDKYGVKEFCEKCRSIVTRYTQEWEATVERMARWVDFKNDYKTMDPNFMESIWWVFGQLWDKGLLYEGYKSMHVCPRCVTPLSNFEVTLGYKEVKDTSVFWKFKLVGEKNTYVLAWTTTPWSSISTMGLAIGTQFTYVKARVGNEFIICAKDRLDFVMKGVEGYQIVDEFKGEKLVGKAYKHIVDFMADVPEVKQNSGVYHIYGTDYVEVTEGTGIVTINGAYGEIDMQAAKANNLPVVMDVDMDGHFNALGGPYKGLFIKEAESKIIDDGIKKGVVWRKEPYVHSYPHCWRCDSPLLNYATSSWFVKVEQIKQMMLANNAQIHWVPEHVGKGRFGEWLSNARDWCISRNRFWGTPLPIWRSDDGDTVCVKSMAELETLTGKKVTDLHKHLIDDLTFEKDGKTYRRIPEVLDCWFESGSMPYAQMHYPFENKKRFEQNFPAEFIAEGLDQTRGWFYTLVVLGTALFNKPAFKNVIVNGMILAEDGKKMSKRLKNYPEPGVIFDKYGADALRFYLMNSSVVKAEPLRFSERGVEEVVKGVILPLWNAYSFFVTYANIDGWKPSPERSRVQTSIAGVSCDKGASVSEKSREAGSTKRMQSRTLPRNKQDRWILSELHYLIQEVTEQLDGYDLQKACEPIVGFVDDLTNWYIRRSRRRFWKSESDTDKAEAYETLHTVLKTLSQVIAPFMPCTAESIYRNLTGEESVHLSDWPTANKKQMDEALRREFHVTRTVVTLGHSVRSNKRIKVRQPLQKAQIGLPQGYKGMSLETDVIAEELNVKTVELLKNASEVAELQIKPNARKLGPKHGKEVQTILQMAKAGDAYLENDGRAIVGVYTLEKDEFEMGFVAKEGYDVAASEGIVVALDTELTDALRLEGIARELVRTIQEMRKEADYKVDDRITVSLQTTGDIQTALTQFKETIAKETLATVIQEEPLKKPDHSKTVEIEGREVHCALTRERK
jgi:isoleucyl-tRNA synthetase